jgi:hypothetical protein
MVWEFLADWMHISEGCLKTHLIPMLKGKRNPTPKDRRITVYVILVWMF